jgi:glycosyltransferase involved in cell wall biosynthesis
MRSVGDPAAVPRVSVLVRTKDRPGLLAEALESLRRQTFSDFEVILVNDGGPLGAASLEQAPGRGLTIVVPPRPGGRARALNAGLAAAKGTYAAYLDDDDLYLPEHLESLVHFLDGSDEYGGAYGSVRQIEQVLGEDGKYRDGRELHVYAHATDANRVLYKNDVPLIALMHRRDLAEKAGGFDESQELYEDWDFLIRLSVLTRLRHLPRVTAVYRVRNDASNVTGTVAWGSPEAHAARLRIFSKYAARRSPATDLSLVDGFDRDVGALLDERRVLATRIDSLGAELAAAGKEAVLLTQRLADSHHRTEETATREQALSVENARLSGLLAAVQRSLIWRLFTPWWKLREALRK